MSKLSIYETNWINLVFEGRNKGYGAYQLRKECDRTSLLAFFMGLMIITSIFSISKVIQLLTTPEKIKIDLPEIINIPIVISDIETIKPKKPVEQIISIKKKSEPDVYKKEQLVNPIIVNAIDSDNSIASNKENSTTTTINTEGEPVGTSTTTTSEIGTKTTPNTSENEINSINALDKRPEFPGGINKFYNYVANNFEKPVNSDENEIRVLVSFVIEKNGTMTEIHVKNNPSDALAAEAIRVLKSLKTKWTPGTIGGNPVRTAYNLPIIVPIE
jgi:hypothetical protein